MGVALVRNDANINYPADLQGKISCHTGYGRTVGWFMPIPRVKFYILWNGVAILIELLSFNSSFH